jgi:hypothetical protein
MDARTDMFLHNAGYRGMVGMNHGEWRPNDPLDQFGLTWMTS